MKATSLTQSDLQLLVSIIDVCATRGAFKGEELLNVGQLREKLVTALQPQEAVNTVDTSGAE